MGANPEAAADMIAKFITPTIAEILKAHIANTQEEADEHDLSIFE